MCAWGSPSNPWRQTAPAPPFPLCVGRAVRLAPADVTTTGASARARHGWPRPCGHEDPRGCPRLPSNGVSGPTPTRVLVALLGGVDSSDRPAHGRPLAAHEDEIYFASRRAHRAASSYGTAFMGACGGRALWNSAAERRDAERSEVATADRKLPLFEQPGHGTRVCPTFFSAPTCPHCWPRPGTLTDFARGMPPT